MEKKLEQVARLQGVPVSEVIREAVAIHCEKFGGQNLREDLADVIGAVESGGGRADRTGDAFKRLLAQRRKT